ncbi:MAG: hypothetical protein A2103_05515 [Gammaproteobacteria bacterium GWF2_41_13]|nr:MAG: hypothetical protein A2103_05515 [Gammaproteobacteria bacterium GWF2_41_13]
MSSEQKEKSPLFIWPVRVYYEDTDCGGVVYHTSYIRFMERARSEQVISLGFGQAAWSNMQIGFAVSALQIDYLQPAKLYDQLQVETQLLKIARASVVYEQVIRQTREAQRVYCQATIKVVCVGVHDFKPCAIPHDLRTALLSFNHREGENKRGR